MRSLYLLLVFQVFGWQLIQIPGEAVVYYVIPTSAEPPSADCPQDGQHDCQTLDHYFSHKEEYFNSSKVNVTMLLLAGEHVLSEDHTECVSVSGSQYAQRICGLVISNLETFEMIGLEQAAYNYVVQLSTNLILKDITKHHFANLDINSSLGNGYYGLLLVGLHVSKVSISQSTEMTGPIDPVEDNVTGVIVIVNGTIFNGTSLKTYYSSNHIQFSTTVANSWFNHGFTDLLMIDGLDLYRNVQKNYARELIITNCTFSNSNLLLIYTSTHITVSNSTLSGGMLYLSMATSNVEITGTVRFSNTDPNSLVLFISSNVQIAGNVTFSDISRTSISAYLSNITLSGNISFLNNTGVNGGAMALYSSALNIAPNTSIFFYNNTATETGGAIYVHNRDFNLGITQLLPCFYQFLDNSSSISFCNNSAKRGGDDIYGALMHSGTCYTPVAGSVYNALSCCAQKYFYYDPKSTSSVSSDPLRVCLCEHGIQLCNKTRQVPIKIHPGETFTLSVLIVGADLGKTIGSVHAVFENPSTTVQLKPTSQYMQGISEIKNGVCSMLNYTVFSSKQHERLLLTIKEESWTPDTVSTMFYGSDPICKFCDPANSVSIQLLLQQLYLNITLLPCPSGFQLVGDHGPPDCKCHPVLADNNVTCQFINHVGYHIWSGPQWIDANASNVYVAHYCPFDYCRSGEKTVNLDNESNTQCAFNRAGRLCGGCKEGYSLAIGSSNCIHCPNNNNLALLIVFAAAGILLVAVIDIFNLTVTQGMINGLIFYANIVWTYQSVLFSQQVEPNVALVFLRTLLAWLNLDFGIQTCFVQGLNALHKTWPQYFFILYIWCIAIVIIFAASHSIKLTEYLGGRPVHILVTLFLLSYTKLFQIVIASVEFTQIDVFDSNSTKKSHTFTAWSLDSNYIYCHYPHALLFIAALLVFFIVWLPYTLVLFAAQWLRKKSCLKLPKWVPAAFDVHLAPLKDKHHYWFGVLLIVRGILLVILTLTYTVYPEINYIMLLITASLLLMYSNYYRVYKNKLVQFNDNFFLILLIVIGTTGILEQQARRIIIYASIGIGLVVFCGITVGLKLFQVCCKKRKQREFVLNEQRRRQQQNSDSALSREAILHEIEPLLGDTEVMPTY